MQTQTQNEHAVTFVIFINEERYEVHKRSLTGLELKTLAKKTPDYLLFEEIRGHKDRLIGNDEVVEMKDDLRFYTEPAGTYG